MERDGGLSMASGRKGHSTGALTSVLKVLNTSVRGELELAALLLKNLEKIIKERVKMRNKELKWHNPKGFM
jgi:hypothetical protein